MYFTSFIRLTKDQVNNLQFYSSNVWTGKEEKGDEKRPTFGLVVYVLWHIVPSKKDLHLLNLTYTPTNLTHHLEGKK